MKANLQTPKLPKTDKVVEQCQLNKENEDKIIAWLVKACPELGAAQPQLVLFFNYNASEEKSQKDQVVTASKPSKPLLT